MEQINGTGWARRRSLLAAIWALSFALTAVVPMSRAVADDPFDDGRVFVWGCTECNPDVFDVPEDLDNAVAIEAGAKHALALTDDGKVVAWGSNSWGQTDVPDWLDNVVAIAAGTHHSLALTADGQVVGWGGIVPNTGAGSGAAIAPFGVTDFVAIDAGWNVSMGVRSDGSVMLWGDAAIVDGYPPPATLTDVVKLVGSISTFLALSADGTVTQWGALSNNNFFGYWNVPALTDVVAIDIVPSHAMALSADGTVSAWGEPFIARPPADLRDVIDIAAGYEHSIALRSDGSIVAWGGEHFGLTVPPIGIGIRSVRDVSAGSAFSMALMGDPVIGADDDGDGVPNDQDAFPLDPSESNDHDGDGIGDNADLDDDNDGQTDADEAACGSDPLDAGSTSDDQDGDGVPDCADPDIDGDGVTNGDDVCADTILPDTPTHRLKKHRYVATVDGFESIDGVVAFTLTDTAGCSGAQIIEASGLHQGHIRHGLSRSALQAWVGGVNRSAH